MLSLPSFPPEHEATQLSVDEPPRVRPGWWPYAQRRRLSKSIPFYERVYVWSSRAWPVRNFSQVVNLEGPLRWLDTGPQHIFYDRLDVPSSHTMSDKHLHHSKPLDLSGSQTQRWRLARERRSSLDSWGGSPSLLSLLWWAVRHYPDNCYWQPKYERKIEREKENEKRNKLSLFLQLSYCRPKGFKL